MTTFLYISLAVAALAMIATTVVFIRACRKCTHREVTRDEDSCYCNHCGQQLIFDRESRNWVSPKP